MKAPMLALLLLLLASGCGSSRPGEARREDTRQLLTTQDLYDRLRSLPGVYVNGNGDVNIRRYPSPPLLVVDGLPVAGYNINFINPPDILDVDVLTGAEAALYGSRGGGGVLVFTTRSGASRE